MKKIFGILFLCFISCSAYAGSTDATVATVANSVIEQIDGVPNLFSAISYTLGVIFGYRAALKLKEMSDSKSQARAITPIMLIIASALLLGLPTVLKMGVDTVGYDSGKVKYEY